MTSRLKLAAILLALTGPPTALTISLSDGTNTVPVKAASTPAATTDPALVVAISPNNTVAVTQSGGWSVTGTIDQHGTWTMQPGNTANTTPWLMSINDGTNTAKVTAASSAVAAADKALAVGLSPNSPLPTGANVIGALTSNQSVNVSQVGGVTAVNGGLVGTLAVGGTQANNATITANPILLGARSEPTASSFPNAVVSTGLSSYVSSDPYGDVWTRDGSPAQTGLWIAGLSTTLTQEIAAPGASTSIYVTDLLCQSTTATASTCQLKWGTGSNCGTGTVAGPIYTAPLNTANPTEVHSPHYIVKVPANTALCLVCGSATNTCNIALGAYVAQ